MVGSRLAPTCGMEPPPDLASQVPELAPTSSATRFGDAQREQDLQDLAKWNFGQRLRPVGAETAQGLGNDSPSAMIFGRNGAPDQHGRSGLGGKLTADKIRGAGRDEVQTAKAISIFMALLPTGSVIAARNGQAIEDGVGEGVRRGGHVIDDAQRRVQKVGNHVKPLC